MRTISLESSSFAPTAVVSLATIAAVALLGLVLAYWSWVWFAPRQQPRGEAVPQTNARVETANALFGGGQPDRAGAAPSGVAVRLLGVVAAAGDLPGYAVMQLDAKRSIAVRQGGEIEPGMRLVEVHADHIVLDRSGIRETLAWPKPGKAAAAGTPGTAGAPGTPGAPGAPGAKN